MRSEAESRMREPQKSIDRELPRQEVDIGKGELARVRRARRQRSQRLAPRRQYLLANTAQLQPLSCQQPLPGTTTPPTVFKYPNIDRRAHTCRVCRNAEKCGQGAIAVGKGTSRRERLVRGGGTRGLVPIDPPPPPPRVGIQQSTTATAIFSQRPDALRDGETRNGSGNNEEFLRPCTTGR